MSRKFKFVYVHKPREPKNNFKFIQMRSEHVFDMKLVYNELCFIRYKLCLTWESNRGTYNHRLEWKLLIDTERRT